MEAYEKDGEYYVELDGRLFIVLDKKVRKGPFKGHLLMKEINQK